MKVLIIEDENPAARRLKTILHLLRPEIEVLAVIDSIEEAVNWFEKHECPDLTFMDIQLADGHSFKIFEKVDFDCPVVFTTAYDEYMLDAFRVNGIDYLLKPVKEEVLQQSLEKFDRLKIHFQHNNQPNLKEIIDQISVQPKKFKKRFLVKKGDLLISLLSKDIAYFYSKDGVTYISTFDGKTYLGNHTLDDLEQLNDPEQFFRANRKFLINYQSITRSSIYFKGKLKVEVSPSTKEEILVSREKATSFKAWLG